MTLKTGRMYYFFRCMLTFSNTRESFHLSSDSSDLREKWRKLYYYEHCDFGNILPLAVSLFWMNDITMCWACSWAGANKIHIQNFGKKTSSEMATLNTETDMEDNTEVNPIELGYKPVNWIQDIASCPVVAFGGVKLRGLILVTQLHINFKLLPC